ncbi:hypothetical protein [Nocardioides sp.]|uniref:hypothetical protein n=1 Tax=Nocardioides sp. TaxID=35761 RepID=UPI002CBD30DE|nr:hypothetical protein [Nocardioides sp.]HXH77610.1 hypothetical protein [Nocardioides sp.]
MPRPSLPSPFGAGAFGLFHASHRMPSRGCLALDFHSTDSDGYTYWDYYRLRFERDRGLKIDFVVATPALAARVTGAFIDRDERDPAQGTGSPSDHAPVIVDLA